MYQSMYAYIGYGVINHQHIPQQVLDSAPATDVFDVSYVHSWGYIMGIYCNGGYNNWSTESTDRWSFHSHFSFSTHSEICLMVA